MVPWCSFHGVCSSFSLLLSPFSFSSLLLFVPPAQWSVLGVAYRFSSLFLFSCSSLSSCFLCLLLVVFLAQLVFLSCFCFSFLLVPPLSPCILRVVCSAPCISPSPTSLLPVSCSILQFPPVAIFHSVVFGRL